jgi:hypothetical protein
MEEHVCVSFPPFHTNKCDDVEWTWIFMYGNLLLLFSHMNVHICSSSVSF